MAISAIDIVSAVDFPRVRPVPAMSSCVLAAFHSACGIDPVIRRAARNVSHVSGRVQFRWALRAGREKRARDRLAGRELNRFAAALSGMLKNAISTTIGQAGWVA
jgi:hypothetical protein